MIKCFIYGIIFVLGNPLPLIPTLYLFSHLRVNDLRRALIIYAIHQTQTYSRKCTLFDVEFQVILE